MRKRAEQRWADVDARLLARDEDRRRRGASRLVLPSRAAASDVAPCASVASCNRTACACAAVI